MFSVLKRNYRVQLPAYSHEASQIEEVGVKLRQIFGSVGPMQRDKQPERVRDRLTKIHYPK